jgi:hypothetical protein
MFVATVTAATSERIGVHRGHTEDSAHRRSANGAGGNDRRTDEGASPMTPRLPLETPVTRRNTLTAGTALAAGAVLASTSAITVGTAPAASAVETAANRPGLLHADADLQAAAEHVAAGDAPWVAGKERLTSSPLASVDYVSPRALETVVRGGDGDNVMQLMLDIHCAYQTALRWRLGDGDEYGDKAVTVLNAWSSTLTTITGNADRYLGAGLGGYQLAVCADLMRDHPDLDADALSSLLLDVFYPRNNEFLTDHNGAVISNYWANWDLCTMCSVLAIGGATRRDDLVDQAITYFQEGAGMGSITHAVPYVYDDEGLGQWEESGRDQGHTIMGIGQMGAFCEMAWNLGHDCFGYDDNRFLKGAQYVAKYNLGNDVPFTEYAKQSGPRDTTPDHVGWTTYTEVSSASRGQERPVWELVLGHYAGRQGLAAGWVQQIADTIRPEGGGGAYGSTTGGFDQLGYGTLLFAR